MPDLVIGAVFEIEEAEQDSKTICKRCANYWGLVDGESVCKSQTAPVTNFVTGVKECKVINHNGACLFYK